MNMQQLNSLLADTDHEFGPQVVDNQWWQSLCKDKGVDPSRGVSKQHLLSFYFANPESSIKRDYIRIFIEGAANRLNAAEADMFEKIWARYSQGGDSMNLQQLNSLLADTDHEFGPQVVSDEWWQSLCSERGVDPSKGVSKHHLLGFYFDNLTSSIKRDYIRIFIEGAQLQQSDREPTLSTNAVKVEKMEPIAAPAKKATETSANLTVALVAGLAALAAFMRILATAGNKLTRHGVLIAQKKVN